MSGRRVALIVAGNIHGSTDARSAGGPLADLRGLVDVLGDPELGGFDVELLRDATSAVIAVHVERFLLDRRWDDLALLFIACPVIEDDRNELYLATAETRRDRLAATALDAALITRSMARSRAEAIVLLLDCSSDAVFLGCGAAGHLRSPIDVGSHFIRAEASHDGRARAVVVMPPKPREYAAESSEVAPEAAPDHSDFIDAIVRGISTGAADRDRDGQVSLSDLVDFVQHWLQEKSPQQLPLKWQLGTADPLVIARTPQSVELMCEQPSVAAPLPTQTKSPAAGPRSNPAAAVEPCCPYCGEKNTDDRHYCSRCGQMLHAIPAESPASVSRDPPSARGRRRTGRHPKVASAPRRSRPPARQPTLQAAIDAAVDEIVKEGRLLFNPPDQMRQGRVERLEVAIARTKGLDEKLRLMARGPGSPQIEDVETSPFMAVELTGAAFEVTPLNSATEQLLRPTALWEFDVLPQRSGQQKLRVSVAMRIPLPNRPDEKVSVPVLEREIRVAVDPRYTVQHFIRQNWQWCLATFAGLGGALAAWLKLIHGGG
jgi:hypothetical protein